MALDPSISLQTQAPQIQSPIDAASKYANLQNMMLQNKTAQQAYQDDQDARNAFKQNTTLDANGNPTLNRPAALAQLSQTSPLKALDYQKQFQGQDLAKLKNQGDITQAYLKQILPDGSNWADVKNGMIRSGIQSASQMPDVYSPSFVQTLQTHLLDGGKQLDLMMKQKELDQKTQEMGLKKQEIGLQGQKYSTELAHYGNDKQMKAVEDFNSGVEAARQSPDAQQQLKDVLAAKKINEIASQAPGGDLNKLNPQQTKLAMMEVVKMAGGSVPTEGELESMTPDNLAQRYAGQLQKYTNSSQPANAGEFLQQGMNYANGIAAIGKQSLMDRSNRIADRLQPYLGSDQYGKIKGQISNEFEPQGGIAKQGQPSGPASAASHPDAGAAAQFVKQTLSNPKASPSDIAKANAIKQRLGI